MRYYKLEEKSVIPLADVREWAIWLKFFPDKKRVVAQDTVGSEMISTVFVGIGWPYDSDSANMVFETMVFDGDEAGDVVARYATWSEAEAGHAMCVDVVRGKYDEQAAIAGRRRPRRDKPGKKEKEA